MTDNIIKFPNREAITPDAVLEEAIGKYAHVVLIGITPEGKADYTLCAEDAEQVLYLLRMLEHLVIANELA